MTKRKKSRKKDTKKLLIVEDNMDFLITGHLAGVNRGYEVDLACDLEDALALIESRRYDGIITDMCFQEKGINTVSDTDNYASIFLDRKKGIESWADRNVKLSKKHDSAIQSKQTAQETINTYEGLDQKIFSAYDSALSKSELKIVLPYKGASNENLESRGLTEDHLRTIVTEKSIPTIDEELLKKIYFDRSGYAHELSFEEFRENVVRCNSIDTHLILSASNPALGYFVIEEAKKKNLPVSVVTRINHADHALPAILATGVLSEDELLFYANKTRQRSEDNAEPSQYALETERWKELLGKDPMLLGQNLDWIKFYSRNPNPDRLEIGYILKRRFPSLFKKAIIVPFIKQVQDYNFAIDQIEGKIDETRPYKLS